MEEEKIEKYIILESNDGFRYWVEEKCLIVSETLKNNIFSDEFKQKKEKVINLKYESYILEKIVEYLCYKRQYDMKPHSRPKFDVALDISMKLTVAAYELKI